MKYAARVALAAFVVVAFVSQGRAQEFQGTMKKVKSTGVITLGVRETSVPFSYLDENKRPVGYSVDLCVKVADEVKRELKMPNLRVRMLPVNPQTRIPLLVNGTIDIECGVLTNTLERHHQVDFTPTIFLTGTRILARKGSGIKELEDFAGKSIALVQGTIEERIITDLIAKKHIANVKILNVKENPEGVMALQGNRVDAFVSDDVQLHSVLAKRPELKSHFEVTGRLLSFDPIALVIRRNDADFAYAASAALVDLFRSGEILTIYHKWFDSLGLPPTGELLTTFRVQALP